MIKLWFLYLFAQCLDILSTDYGQSHGLVEANAFFGSAPVLLEAKLIVTIFVGLFIFWCPIPKRIKVAAIVAPSCALILAAVMNTLLAANLI